MIALLETNDRAARIVATICGNDGKQEQVAKVVEGLAVG